MDFGRLITAMATPFRTDGSVDDEGIRVLVDHLLQTGTTAIVVCGTTGESPTLSHEEKLLVIRETLKAVNRRVPVIAGTGGNDTAASIELSKEAQELGVDGVLLVAPYYNRPTQDGLFAHFATIAESIELPVMIYNIPGRTAVNIEVDTVLRLAQVPNIVAVKESSGDFRQIAALCARKPDDFYVYSGDDWATLPALALGAYGVVSVAAHVIGQEMRQMIEAFAAGRTQEAAMWNGRLLPMMDSLFQVTSPSPLKAALRLLGLPGGNVRLPLLEAPERVVLNIKRELERLNKL